MQLVPRVCVLLAVLGCGKVKSDNRPDAASDAGVASTKDDGAHSGSRIKLMWHDYGGTRVLLGMFDAQRQETCRSVAWSDGKMYCAPSFNTVAYTDASCTQRAGTAYHDPTCPQDPPAYFAELAYVPCSATPTHLYPRGPRIAATQYYTKGTNGTCSGAIPVSNVDVFSLGDEVPASALAELTRTQVDTGTRLAPQFLTSADGARVFDSPHDAMLGTDCALSREYDGTTGTCRPSLTFQSNLYGDAACTTGEVARLQGCPKPNFAAKAMNPGCPSPGYRYFSVGDAVPPASPLYLLSGGKCTASTPTTSVSYYPVGTEVSPIQLVRSHDDEPGRQLQLFHFVDGQNRYRDFPLYDVNHQTECTEYAFSDRSVRCLPTSAGIGNYYRDSGCTQQIELIPVFSGAASCGLPLVPSYALKYIPPATGTCSSSYEIYAVGTAYTATVYYQNGVGCVPVATDSVYYQVGAKHPLDEFPLATTVTDP